MSRESRTSEDEELNDLEETCSERECVEEEDVGEDACEGMLMPFRPCSIMSQPIKGSDGVVVLLPSSARSSASGSANSTGTPNIEDRIGSFFGLSESDQTIPRAAYEAMLHRVHSLESSLGQANREIRQHTAGLTELQENVQRLEQQLQKKEDEVRVAHEREIALEARERDVSAREQSLDAMARHQRRSLKRRLGLPLNEEVELFAIGTTSDPPQRRRGEKLAARRGEPERIEHEEPPITEYRSSSHLPQLVSSGNGRISLPMIARSHTSLE